MQERISTEADKDAVLAQIASIRKAEPGSDEERRLMKLVMSVSDYVAKRDQSEEIKS